MHEWWVGPVPGLRGWVGVSVSGRVVVALAVVGWVGGGGVLSLFAGGSVRDLGVRVSAEWGLIGGGSRVGVHPRFIVGGGVGVCGRVCGGGGGGAVGGGRSRGVG